MPIVKQTPFETDEDGFLKNPQDWDGVNGRWVSHFLPEEDIEVLSDDHKKVIETLRASYEESMHPIEMKCISKITDTPFSQIYRLFPSGPVKGAYKIAGIPKPVFNF